MNNRYVWKSDIAQKAQQFLQIKHMTGFKYDVQEKYLQRFDAYYCHVTHQSSDIDVSILSWLERL